MSMRSTPCLPLPPLLVLRDGGGGDDGCRDKGADDVAVGGNKYRTRYFSAGADVAAADAAAAAAAAAVARSLPFRRRLSIGFVKVVRMALINVRPRLFAFLVYSRSRGKLGGTM